MGRRKRIEEVMGREWKGKDENGEMLAREDNRRGREGEDKENYRNGDMGREWEKKGEE